MGIQLNGTSGTDVISAVDGSLTVEGLNISDSIIHLGDTNTKLRFPAADTFTAETGGTERLRIASNGNVGIGTDDPSQKLEVLGTTNLFGNGGAALQWGDTDYVGHLSFASDGAIIRSASGKALIFHTNHVNERMRINSNGQISIRGTTTAFDTTGDLDSLQLYYETDSGQASIGPYSSGGSTHLSFYTNLSSAAATEKIRINSYGQIITGGGTGISFNNVGNSAFGSFFEVNGTHTTNHHGVLGISGITTTNNARVGLVQFLNTSNTNSSSTGNAASRSLAHISVYADTSDGNAGNDSGGRIVIGTKGEAAGMNDLLFLTSDKTVGIQAIPAVGDMNSTATGGAALSDPKLYVYDGGTNGKYNLMIRCNSGSDADNTGSAIALNHSNDRGILIEGGRWSGNRSWGAIKAIDNIGRVSDCIAIRGGNGAGVQDFRIYTGEAVTTTERLRIDSSGILYHKPSGATSSAYLKAENTSTTYFLKAQKDGAVDTNLSLNVQDGGSLKTLLYLRGDNKTVAVGPDITPYRNLHVQEHFLVANKGTNSNQPYVSSTPILAVGTDGQNIVPGDSTYRHNALVLFGVGGHNAGNPAANSYSGLCPALGYFKLDLYGQTGLGDVGTNLDSTLSIRSINPNNTRLRIRTKDNYNGTYPDASISFTQQQGTEIARIECDTNTGAANMADLVFYTNFGGLYERLRIDKQGKIDIAGRSFTMGTQSDSGSSVGITGNAWSNNEIGIKMSHQVSGGQSFFVFYNTNGQVGYIQSSGSGTIYNTGSDYRLKENQVLISDGITRLKQLKPYRFNFKKDPSTTLDGFFAHEVQSVVPESIAGTKDEVATKDEGDRKKGDPILQGMDYGRITPLLTAALQEAIAKIETLEAKVAALESS